MAETTGTDNAAFLRQQMKSDTPVSPSKSEPSKSVPLAADELMNILQGMTPQRTTEAVNVDNSASKQDVNPAQLMAGKHVLDLFMSDPSDERSRGASILGNALDTASLGFLDEIAVGAASTAASLLGVDEETVTDAADAVQQRYNDNLGAMRRDNPISSFMGQIGGSLAPGAAIAGGLGKTFAGLGWRSATRNPILRNLTVTTTAGATEAGMYRLGSDGSLEEAAVDAALGGAGALIIGSLFSIGGGLAEKFRTPSTSALKERVGSEFLYAIRSASPDGKNISVTDLVERVEAAGPEAVIADIYPELLPMVRGAAAEGMESADNFAKLLQSRNALSVTFKDQVQEVLGAKYVPTLQDFTKAQDTIIERLRPAYDSVLDGKTTGSFAQGLRFKSTGVRVVIQQALDINPGSVPRKAFEQAQSRVKKLMSRYTRGGTMDARSLHNLKQDLGDEIAKRLKNGMPTAALTKAKSAINAILEEHSPKYAELNLRHGDAQNRKDMFSKGVKFFRAKDFLAADMIDELADASHPEAFIAGVKRAMLNDVRVARSNKAVSNAILQNPDKLEKLRAVAGDEVVSTMLQQVDQMAKQIQTMEAIMEGVKAGPSGNKGGTALQSLMDLSIMGQGVTGQASGIGPPFAARRLMGRDVATGAAKAKEAAIAQELLTQPGSDLYSVVRDSLNTVNKPFTEEGFRRSVIDAAIGSRLSDSDEAVQGAIDVIDPQQ